MRRVAALCLPDWSIDRLRRAGRIATLPERAALPDTDALAAQVAAERANECSVPKTPGWRPGARWAKAELQAQIEALPLHQRPPMRELGRRSEAADPPFRAMRPDEAKPSSPLVGRGAELREAMCRGHIAAAEPARKASRGRRLVERKGHERHAPTPIVTTHREGNRILVRAACPNARALGIRPGMALTSARASVPGLEAHPADPQADARGLHRLAIALARKWSPQVAIGGEDLLFLDLTGVSHLFGGEAAMATRIVAVLARAGHHAQLAVADTPGAAAALVRHGAAVGDRGFATPRPRHAGMRAPSLNEHPRHTASPFTEPAAPPPSSPRTCSGVHLAAHEGREARSVVSADRWTPEQVRGDAKAVLIVPPHTQAEHLSPLPVTALRIDASDAELMKRLGVERIGQLMRMPRAPLARRFAHALARLDQALGRLPEPLDPVVPVDAITCRQGFLEPIATPEGIAHWLGQLVPRMTQALAEAGLGARAIELVAERVDHVPQRLRIGLARATRDPAHILRLIARRIEEVEPGYGIDAMTLHVRRADPLGPLPVEERLDHEAAPDLAPLVDAIINRIGARRLWRTRAVESDVPERSVAVAPPLSLDPDNDPNWRADDVRLLDTSGAPPAWHPDWPRPARLLRRPERLDHVVAELPDRPPVRFTWRGVSHRVVRADGPERIHGEWWRRMGEAQAVRDYFRVEDEDGRRYWLYRRGDGARPVTGDLSWWLHGLFG